MTFDLNDVTAGAVGRILDAAPGRQPHGLAAPRLCGTWHPKLPWLTCARDVAHLADAGSLCLGIEARSGQVYSWLRTGLNRTEPGMVIDGDVFHGCVEDAVEDVLGLVLTEDSWRQVADAALAGAHRAGMTILRGADLRPWTPDEALRGRESAGSVDAGGAR